MYRQIVIGNIAIGVTSIMVQAAVRDCISFHMAVYTVSIVCSVVDVLVGFRKITHVMNITEEIDSMSDLVMASSGTTA